MNHFMIYNNLYKAMFVKNISNSTLIIVAILSVITLKFTILLLYLKRTNKTLREESDKQSVAAVFDDQNDSENLYLDIRFNYSFLARLHQAGDDSQERFSTLKNYMLSFENIKIKSSWKYERYTYLGKTILKIWIHGSIIKAYFNIEPSKLYGKDYNIDNVSYAKMHETTPTLLKVTNNKTLNVAMKIIDIFMKDKSKQGKILNINYKLPYLSKEQLIEKQLIKVINK